MMVETVLESSQDFGMSSGSVPQWKRELLQRRASRPRVPAPIPIPSAHPPLPPPAPPCSSPPSPAPSSPAPAVRAATLDDEEELRYGPGIVKRLQSRYLSLALREQPRRRSAVLRRAASLEHLLEPPAPPPPRPAPRPARPISLALPPSAQRRDSIKRARSVDALSRLERRPPSPAAPPAPAPSSAEPDTEQDRSPSEGPPARGGRPPRRPRPLLREAERPPVDLVRAALRKFEPGGPKRGAPAARVAAVLRGLEPRTSTPEPRAPSPSLDVSCVTPGGVRPVSRAALEGIARAGSSTRYSFHQLPPRAAVNHALVQRRVGVIRPLPPAQPPPPPPPPRSEDVLDKPRLASPPALLQHEPDPPPVEARKELPPSAAVEPVVRSPPPPSPDLPRKEPLLNGYRSPPPRSPPPDKPHEARVNGKPSKISAAKIECGWHAASDVRSEVIVSEKKSEVNGTGAVSPWPRGGGGGGGGRQPAPAAVSIVFNFSNRKEVPDYIENDGVILRTSKRDKIKAGDPGVVVLDPVAARAARSSSDSDSDSDSGSDSLRRRPLSPCRVRFLNDNVLINGKSSLLQTANNKDRIAKLKLQFDDSLTRTFEYPSETSLCEEEAPPSLSPTPTPPPPAAAATLLANTHIASAALCEYTPSKTRSTEFRLGVTRHEAGLRTHTETSEALQGVELETGPVEEAGLGEGAARSWSEARTHRTDLLF